MVEQVSGHVPYSLEDADAAVETIADQGRIQSGEERSEYIDAWTQGVGHGERDPEAKYYGVDNPIGGYLTQPFHLGKETHARTRRAVGVEKYGGPVTEGSRQHEMRALHGGRVVDDKGSAIGDGGMRPNPDVALLRKAANKIADELYEKVFAQG